MSRLPLAGTRTVVTRARAQSGPLRAAIEAAGGVAFEFPCLAIEPNPSVTAAAALSLLDASDAVVFVSPNAVRVWGELVGAQSPLSAKRVFAVGQGTARALIDLGVDSSTPAACRETTEGLLALDYFRDAGPHETLLVRGIGGRERFAREMRDRGHPVHVLEVYRRVRPQVAASVRDDLHRQIDALDFVVLTSNAVADNFFGMIDPEAGERLRRDCCFVVVSERIAQTLASRRIEHIAVSPGAGVDAIVATIGEEVMRVQKR
ncbi:MAG: uroporphyrinogen-III synthase [Pseudomonadota bacterium]